MYIYIYLYIYIYIHIYIYIYVSMEHTRVLLHVVLGVTWMGFQAGGSLIGCLVNPVKGGQVVWIEGRCGGGQELPRPWAISVRHAKIFLDANLSQRLSTTQIAHILCELSHNIIRSPIEMLQ
jgi:hypothetical protein